MLKKIYFFSVMFLASLSIYAQNPLILKYFVSSPTDLKIRLTTQGSYNYSFEKTNNATITGSGIGLTGVTEITVPQTGTYNVSVVPAGVFKFSSANGNSPDIDKITAITQWGNVTWNSDLSYMFKGYSNLQITASDIPDFSQVTAMNNMFESCTNFSIANNINNWNVSSVINMSNMFAHSSLFNQDIGLWNVANVTDMSRMFLNAGEFNKNIGSWNVSNVIDTHNMFDFAQKFNQDISVWDVSNVTNMNGMLNGAIAFNQNIGLWQLSPIVTLAGLLNGAGLDCNNFGATLKGWAENSNTPIGRLIGVEGKYYGPNGQIYMGQLINNKGWTFSGTTYFAPSCSEQFLETEDISSGKSMIMLFPNPASEKVFIKSEKRTKSVQVVDASGKIMLNLAKVSEIGIQQLPAGIYLVKITLEDNDVTTHKLIKK